MQLLRRLHVVAVVGLDVVEQLPFARLAPIQKSSHAMPLKEPIAVDAPLSPAMSAKFMMTAATDSGRWKRKDRHNPTARPGALPSSLTTRSLAKPIIFGL